MIIQCNTLRTASICIGLAFALLATPVSAASVVSLDQWVPQAGDQLIVDVVSNTGYLVHPDATYLPFLVASGQKRTVHYLGMTYYAATPQRMWVAKDRKIQPDRVNFGVSGRFLRLFADGTKYTAYGIHSYKYIDKWMKEDERYKSLGCVVVTEEIMTIIENTYYLNGNTLQVTTTSGPQKLVDLLSRLEQSI